MLTTNQVIDEVKLENFRGNAPERMDIYVKVDGKTDVRYSLGDYFPETKQIQFYGARLTATQILKIMLLIEQEVKEVS